MAVGVKVHPTENYFVIKVSGDTDAETVAAAYSEAIESAEYQHNMNCMWDICDTKLSQFSMTEVRELVQLVKQYSSQRGADYKVAILTLNNVDYQLLRVYSSFFRLAGKFRMKVVNQPDLAKTWITAED